MTYERPQEVIRTVEKLLAQTFPPQKILVVDNSLSHDTAEAIGHLTMGKVVYHRMGFNAGPAGAAATGLSMLTADGYEWIFWGDDDDPPPYPESFHHLFKIIEARPHDPIGVIGALGGKLNRKTGRTLNYSNRELEGIVEADYIPGNKLMIVHGDVVKRGVLPAAKLFFGFEELDFCLKVKNAGFKILFDGTGIRAQRVAAGNTSASYRWRGKAIGDERKLWRQYYSSRNMLYILKLNKLWIALIYNLFRIPIKSIYGFRFGWSYGTKLFRLQWLALFHFVSGRFGKTDLENTLS